MTRQIVHLIVELIRSRMAYCALGSAEEQFFTGHFATRSFVWVETPGDRQFWRRGKVEHVLQLGHVRQWDRLSGRFQTIW